MALLGLTSANAKLAKWIIRGAGEAVPVGLAWLLDNLAGNGEAAESMEWRRFVIRWTRATPTGTVEDLAQFKIDLINITADEVDTSWTDADNALVRARINTFGVAIAPYCSSAQAFLEVRGYRMRFNPVGDLTRPFLDTGTPVYVNPFTQAMSGTPLVPYQVAPTVTFRTAWPKHWGRIYLPTPGSAALDTNGRLTSTYRTTVGTAAKTFLGGLHDDGFYPVIPVGQLDKQPFHALLGVTQVVVDDVPDVQRRRRPKMPAARTIA